MEALIRPLLEHGVLGIVAAIALWFAYSQTRKAEACQEKRVADIERVLSTMAAGTQAIIDNTEITQRMVKEVDQLNDRRFP